MNLQLTIKMSLAEGEGGLKEDSTLLDRTQT